MVCGDYKRQYKRMMEVLLGSQMAWFESMKLLGLAWNGVGLRFVSAVRRRQPGL